LYRLQFLLKQKAQNTTYITTAFYGHYTGQPVLATVPS